MLRAAIFSLLCLSLSLWGADLRVSIDGQAVVLSLPDGRIVWRTEVGGAPPGSVTSLGNGEWQVDNGYVLNFAGRIISSGPQIRALSPKVTSPIWGTPAQLFPTEPGTDLQYSNAGPAFDGQGNAYEAQTTIGGPNSLRIVKSNGASGTWSAPQTIYNFSLSDYSYASCFNLVSDSAGNLTLLCSAMPASGGYEFMTFRYTVGSGWSGPRTLYLSTVPPSSAFAVGDSHGDVVVVLIVSDASGHTVGNSYVYSASAQQWLPPVGVAPVSAHARGSSFTLRTNRTGSAIYLAYLDILGVTTGIYAQVFDIDKLTWGPAKLIPNTTSSVYTVDQSGSDFPMAVDPSGTATIFFNLRRPGQQFYADVRASRYQNGGWSAASSILQANNVEFDLINFADAAAGASEVGMAALGFQNTDQVGLYFFSYDGTAWKIEIPAVRQGSTFSQVACAFTGTANAAVIQYQDNSGSSSVYNDGTGWSAPAAIPESRGGTGELGTNTLGKTVLIFAGNAGPDGITDATWLQN